MSTLKTYEVILVTKGLFAGTVEATSETDAVEQTFQIWRTECPHPFEQCDDELVSVEATEVSP